MTFQPESVNSAASSASITGASEAAALVALRTFAKSRPHNTAPLVAFKPVHEISIPDRTPLSEFVGEWTREKSERFDFRVDASLDEVQEFSKADEKEWENVFNALALAPYYYSPSAHENSEIFAINPPNQYRRSGEPTVVHPIRVATRYAEWCCDDYIVRGKDIFDPQVYTALVFHDIKENSSINPRTLETFGERCCAIVDDLTVKTDRRLGHEKTCESLRQKLRTVRNESLLGRALDAIDNAETLVSWYYQPTKNSKTRDQMLKLLTQNDLWIREKRDSICQVLNERIEEKKGKGGQLPNVWPLLARAREELNEALNNAEKGVREIRGEILGQS